MAEVGLFGGQGYHLALLHFPQPLLSTLIIYEIGYFKSLFFLQLEHLFIKQGLLFVPFFRFFFLLSLG